MKVLLYLLILTAICPIYNKPMLKTKYVYEYTDSNPNVDFSPDLVAKDSNLISIFHYNKKGQEIRHENFKNGKINSIDDLKYDNDVLVEITADTNYTYFRTHEIVYHPSKDVTCNSIFNNGKKERTFCTESNEKGKAISSVLINSKGDTIHTSKSNYDHLGRKITNIEYDKEGNMSIGYYFSYSKLDTFYTTQLVVGSSGKLFLKLDLLDYKKNETKNLLSTDVLYANIEENYIDTMKIRTFYNEQNQIVKKYFKSPMPMNQRNWRVTEYEYEYH